MTPTNDLASLTGATDHATMTADETYRDCSTPATSDANPSLALTGEVVLRLPSVFIRTVRAPDERAGFPNSPNYRCGGSYPGLAHRVDI